MLSEFDKGAFAPCPAPFNLAAHVLAAGAATPEKIALSVITPTTSDDWSYARLIAAVRGTATGLLQAGLVPGDIVLMRLGNTVDFPIAYLGAIAAGIVPVPTSSQLTAGEVAKMVAHLAPKAILRAPDVPCPEVDIPVFGPSAYEAWHALPPADFAMGDPDRLAYIIYTSGTSGTPRAVGHAHRAIWARQMMMDGWYAMTPDDRLLHAGAFNWTFTLGTGLMDPWTRGASALIPADGTDAAQLPLLMKQNDVTLFAAAPGVYRQVLKSPILPMPALRHGLAAGEKLSEGIRDAWRTATGTEIFEAYGMSECSTFISNAPARPSSPGTLGRPQVGRHLAIVDADGQPVPRGAEGTIAIHRQDPGLMLGYIGAPEATAEKFLGDWFLTGDQGSMDDDDQIRYLGRSDDMMNAGGYRVSPMEVEAALAGLPGVTELAVTDIEVKQDVRLIAAFYVSDTPLDEDALRAEAETRLARYKTPRVFVRIDALPRNANNKIVRARLKDQDPL
ncbi:class I adenylate-forming enzyme family protein [Tropicibacter naphthalenivorans]|uniref:Long-chain-fatty-acid--CoA ligase n=1 Tax=Tropicibacter naphthalenivorans TaxID=441103 RepID=A0A0N7LZE7_9RHOB|nr:class I adenylate-forming enzyme family protein [Tropicibacter naphthalenivorans]CUH77457.1 Long-chain-fatty-acid--CoA ligase [Tropicibacter naphthalenivorans]SMC57367.1 Acyl-CoA synthetase (AMP-forming)/AMP-acid ligase II [Tropicibacter naphthalenivorans]